MMSNETVMRHLVVLSQLFQSAFDLGITNNLIRYYDFNLAAIGRCYGIYELQELKPRHNPSLLIIVRASEMRYMCSRCATDALFFRNRDPSPYGRLNPLPHYV